MEKRQNTWYLLRQWILPLILGVILVIALGWRLLQGDYWIIISIIAITGTVVGWVLYSSITQVGKLLQAPAPQPLLAYYDRRLGKAMIAERDANLSFSKALVYTLYGDFESAKTEVDKVNWKQKPPLVQAQKTLLEALWAYLEQNDFQRGLVLAQEAQKMAEVSSTFPGASISLSAYDAVIEIGQVLSGNPEPEVVSSLETRVKRFPVVIKILVVWGLEGYYRQSAHGEQAARMRELLTKLGPYCKGLSRVQQINS